MHFASLIDMLARRNTHNDVAEINMKFVILFT